MDKTELNYKVSQIKKLVNKSDYATAMKIADTIDWRQVRNQAALAMASRVYEKNGEYQDARDILLIAYERSSIGRGILRKLCDLALRAGDVKEAEAYYREYCDQVDDDDATQYLLRYLILEAKKAPIEQQINALEMYCNMELDDKWMYHLAQLYQKAGREDDCVQMCDKVMLMFGLGKYVDKAMELKLQYAPLNKYQMDLVENREKYEQRLREVQEKFSTVDDEDDEVEDEVTEDGDAPADDASAEPASESAEPASEPEETDAPAEETEAGDAAPEDAAASGPVPEAVKPAVPDSDMALAASLHEAKAEEELAREVSKMQSETPAVQEEPDVSTEETKIFHSVRDTAAEAAEPETPAAPAESADEQSETSMPLLRFTLAIDPGADGRTLKTTVGDTLRDIQKELGVNRKVKGIQSASLNNRGVETYVKQLAGADVAVLGAGNLGRNTLEDLNYYMEQLSGPANVVLVDSKARLDKLRDKWGELMKPYMEYDGSDEIRKKIRDAAEEVRAKAAEEQAAEEKAAEEKAAEEAKKAAEARKAEEAGKAEIRKAEEARKAEQTAEESKATEAAKADAEKKAEEAKKAIAEAEAARKAAEEALKAAEAAEKALEKEPADISADSEVPEENYGEAEEAETAEPVSEPEMDIDAFVQYACEYADDCDCRIDGKAKLALYERAEMMQDDGVPLTRENAVDLIERAADRAEKKKLFSHRYDKNGYLILKEKNFFD